MPGATAQELARVHPLLRVARPGKETTFLSFFFLFFLSLFLSFFFFFCVCVCENNHARWRRDMDDLIQLLDDFVADGSERDARERFLWKIHTRARSPRGCSTTGCGCSTRCRWTSSASGPRLPRLFSSPLPTTGVARVSRETSANAIDPSCGGLLSRLQPVCQDPTEFSTVAGSRRSDSSARDPHVSDTVQL